MEFLSRSLLGAAVVTGVLSFSVDAQHATECDTKLRSFWNREKGALLFPGRGAVYGYAMYGKTLQPHSAEEQRKNTLRLATAGLDLVRSEVPSFKHMEASILQGLCSALGNANLKIHHVNVVAQSSLTQGSTLLAVHQDTEEDPSILYTCVVKLTADVGGDSPSKMRVVGKQAFEYGAQAGAACLFDSDLHHESIAPTSETEHLKVVFFFCAGSERDCRARARPPGLSVSAAGGCSGGGGGEAAAAAAAAEAAAEAVAAVAPVAEAVREATCTSGEVIGDLANGHGVICMRPADVGHDAERTYRGQVQYVNGTPMAHGFGVYYRGGVELARGEWREGLLQGLGRVQHQGHVALGNFVGGGMSGLGRIYKAGETTACLEGFIESNAACHPTLCERQESMHSDTLQTILGRNDKVVAEAVSLADEAAAAATAAESAAAEARSLADEAAAAATAESAAAEARLSRLPSRLTSRSRLSRLPSRLLKPPLTPALTPHALTPPLTPHALTPPLTPPRTPPRTPALTPPLTPPPTPLTPPPTPRKPGAAAGSGGGGGASRHGRR